MQNINSQLRKIIPQPCFERPFVCDGQPDSCTVIVIGENPATPLSYDWWEFWNDQKGFNLQEFEIRYEADRLKQGKGKISNTRRRLNRLRQQGLRCLETNAYSHQGVATEKISNRHLLELFINTLPNLKGVIAHGKVAQNFLNSVVLSKDIKVIHLNHFRSESYANIDNAAQFLLTK